MKIKLLALYAMAMITACFAAEIMSPNLSSVEIAKLNLQLELLVESQRTLPRMNADLLKPEIESVRREIRQAELGRRLDPDAGGQPH
jgi:hypothetical protein